MKWLRELVDSEHFMPSLMCMVFLYKYATTDVLVYLFMALICLLMNTVIHQKRDIVDAINELKHTIQNKE